MNSKKNKSALKVQEGIEQPSALNLSAIKSIKKPKSYSTLELFNGIVSGDMIFLSKAITLVESMLPRHQQQAQELIKMCLPFSGKSIRIGITGVPGVGKSTFIEALGMHLTQKQKKVAVLAIDPSSTLSKGSILGDKTRMEELSADKYAFIRPSPSAGTLGGVARKTYETIILCEAAGFEHIFVETVGVGQSETQVHSMVDFFLLLMLAGAGDELQGIKRGIMEMADAVVINKADGNNLARAKLAKAELQNALHFFPLPESGWKPEVLLCSSHEKTGIDELWQVITEYIRHTNENQYFFKKRQEQEIKTMHYTLKEMVMNDFYSKNQIINEMQLQETEIKNKKTTSFEAAEKLLTLYLKKKTNE